MVAELEIIGIGVIMLSPIYAALWYLVILGTENKSNISKMKTDIVTLTERLNNCRYCSSSKGITKDYE